MIGKLIQTDFLKIRRKGLWLLTFLGPVGVVALQMVNYGLRKDYLFSISDDHWMQYLYNVHVFTPLALVLGIAILASFMASIENETNAWKQLVALPVSKWGVYLSKFTVLLCLLMAASVLLLIATLAYGLTLDLGSEIPVRPLFELSFYPLLAALPIAALQLWVATVSDNQGIPITLGVLSVILTYSAYFLPDWMIWKWPTLDNAWDEPLINVGLGLGVGLALYVIGMIDFVRRDVK